MPPAEAVRAPGAGPTWLGHPPALFVLFFTEMWERFSYYGMRALLMLYMVQALHYDAHRAGTVYGLYTGLVYLTPALGGVLADRVLGQRRCILVGGVLMAIGHFVLAVESAACFYAALGLLIVGNGLFKPNIAVIVGRLYAPTDPRRDGAFSIFYMGINLGAFLSPLVCGTLGQTVGWHTGFAAAGVGMLIGLGIYLAGQKSLGELGLAPVDRPTPGHVAVPLTQVERQRIAVLVLLAAFGNIVFWAAFEQAGSSLALFAEASTRLDLPWLHLRMPSSWFQSANPLFIALFAPLFSVAWLRLGRAGREPSAPAKFALGMLLVAAGFSAMVVAGHLADTQGPVSMLWLLAAYLLNTCGELCVSPVGLSVVTRLSPPRYASLLMGLWFASMALANTLSGLFAGTYESMPKAAFFAIPVALTAAAAAVLAALVRPVRRLMHEEIGLVPGR